MSNPILIVDDNEKIAATVPRILEEKGYQVQLETSTFDALIAFYQKPSRFKLLITDQDMTTLSGVAFAERIKTIRPNIPVILLKHKDDTETVTRAKAAGIHLFVPKPVEKTQLLEAVGLVMEP